MTTPWVIAFSLQWLGLISVTLLVLGYYRHATYVLGQAELQLAAVAAGSGPGGLSPGTPVPEFEATLADGEIFTNADLAGKPSLVVFFDLECAPCRALASELRASDLDSLGVDVVLVLPEHAGLDELELIRDLRVVYQRGNAVSRGFKTVSTPHAFAVDAAGVVISSGTPNTFDGLARLAERARGGEPAKTHVVHA